MDSHSTTEDAAVEQMRRQQALARQHLTMYRHPVRTLYYFSKGMSAALAQGARWFVQHPLTQVGLVPALAAYGICKQFSLAPDFIAHVEDIVAYVVWWVGLGILSSIGLGTGMHSGLLFLFPHILKVSLAAETCGHVDFTTHTDTWYSSEPFHCGDAPAGYVSFWDVYKKVAVTGMLWGAGTAIGEIPPYLISYSAAAAGKKAKALQEIEETIQTGSKGSWFERVFARMEAWMMRFIQNHGFFGIFMLASWPNAAFDLCGLCCGAFRMPFWEFFGATLLGKAFVKVNMQAVFFVTLFRRSARERLLGWVEALLPTHLPGLALSRTPAQELHALIDRSIHKFQAKVSGSASAHHTQTWWWQRVVAVVGDRHALLAWARGVVPDTIAEWWGILLVCLIGSFVISCINVLAQSAKAQEDEKALARRPHAD